MADKVAIVTRWITKEYSRSLILDFVGLARSTYHDHINLHERKGTVAKEKKPAGRPLPGYSCTYNGQKVPDGKIEEWICELIAEDGFPYGYRKLKACLNEDYSLRINHKKVHRLCKELGVLQPQRKLKGRKPK